MKTLSERLGALSPEKRRLLERSLARKSAARAGSIERVARDQRHPAMPAQEQIWLETQLNADPALYNESVQLRLSGPLDVDALRRAALELLARHEALRTRIIEEGGRLWQRVEERVELPWEERVVDPGELPELLDELVHRHFDLARAPVFALTSCELEPREHLLVLVVHHVAFDGRSAGIYIQELLTTYAALVEAREPELPPLPLQLVDYGAAVDDQDHAADLDWWEETLAGAPTSLDLPTDAPRPRQREGVGARLHFELDPGRSSAIQATARELGATPSALLASILALVLQARTGCSELVIGSPLSIRRPEVAGVIGPFINTVPLRLRIPTGSFEHLLRHTREVLAAASDHSQAPLQKILARLQLPREPGRTPLFEVLFNLYKTPPEPSVGELRVKRLAVEHSAARFDLALDIEQGPEGLSGWWDYDSLLFLPTTIARIHAHFCELIDAITEDPRRSSTELPRMSGAERRSLDSFNSTEAELGAPTSIQAAFAAQVSRTPEQVALMEGKRRMTFAELARRSNGLAHLLAARGVRPNTVVGVYADRSIEMVIAVLAVLSAGAGYLPLDPAYPAERVAFMLEDARVPLVLGNRRLARLPAGTEHVELDRGWDDASEPPALAADPEHLAYLIYTSGSTGRPNGVLGLHRGMINRLRWMWTRYPFAAGEVVAHKTALSFVDACAEIFGPLLQGVPITLVADAVVKDPPALVEQLARDRVTRLSLVPSLLESLLNTHPRLGATLPDLRICVSSGEALPTELAQRFFAAAPGVRLLNLYGSSEVSADTTACELDPEDPSSWTSIGQPLPNTHVFVVDASGREQPIGASGELCVSGVGLARGYWARPELDARRFVDNPLARGGPIMLRTGDLGRWRADGRLEYLGRIDQQIKVRGSRVEPGEVERALTGDELVDAAVVALREFDTSDHRLVAWYVSARALPPARLRARLARTLPEFMIPSNFVHLERLPLTPSGKVDRHRLPLPAAVRGELGTPYERPSTELERTIAGVWAEHLKLDRVGVLDNFFDLGGHSLLLVEVYSALQARLEQELTMMQLFRHPSVRALARHLEADEVASTKPSAPRARRALRAGARRAARSGQVVLESSPRELSLEACDRVLEDLVVRILGDELGQPMEPTQVFFALGGTAEQATRAITRLSRVCGVTLPARALLQAPTPRELGLYIQAGRQEPRDPRAWTCKLGRSVVPTPSEQRWAAAATIPGRVDPDSLRMAHRVFARHHEELGGDGHGWSIDTEVGETTRVTLRVATNLADPSSTCRLLDEFLTHCGGARGQTQTPSSPLTMSAFERWRERAAAEVVARGWSRPGLTPLPKLDPGPCDTLTRPLPPCPTVAELPSTILALSAWTRCVGPTNVLVSGRDQAAVASLIGRVDTLAHVAPGEPEAIREQLLWALDHKHLGDDVRPGALFWDHGVGREPASVGGQPVLLDGPEGWQRRWQEELHIVGDTLHFTSPRAGSLADQFGAALARLVEALA